MALPLRSMGRPARLLACRGPAITATRYFSASPFRYMPEDPVMPPPPPDPQAEDFPSMPEYSPDRLSKAERSMYDMMSPEDRAAFDEQNRHMVAEFNDVNKRKAMFAELDKKVRDIDKEEDLRFEDIRTKQRGFWAKYDDDEFAQVEDGDEEIHDDEITSMAHAELELHREMREYARITAWDMPMLSKLAKPFTLPPNTHILRFRYTTYLGEQHPAEPKVVVELASQDLTPKYLTEAQRQTFLKLVGPRYNPQTDIVKMSCEKFGSRAQNKRYLADVVNVLIKEAKEGDSFADVPLDLRHHKPKVRPQFPESWKMTEERRKQLAARRAERLSLEQEQQAIVDGQAVLQEAVRTLPSLNPALKAKADAEREKVAVKVGGSRAQRPVRR
ncbi:hypothetical protein N7474_006570 [Penicillium riverlandense]|uniref:uncharacterized protein n=1 Tax=Penicillium riverlandense TaxID=1903569 RepID=UPI0025467114|nr:uncharacterized protein N7474_006570 [Penicillium riverlandense]KAJ5814793.1 hypothetical protein N7474_006570 [Penicillium riverlandense]